MAKPILVTQLKAAIADLGYREIKSLGPNAFGIVVPKTKVLKVIPDLAVILKDYQPTIISDVELRIGDKSVFAKNANLQRGRAAFSQGRGNEFLLQEAIEEYQVDFGKPLTIEFKSSRKKFVCKHVMKVNHVGAKDVFQRNKADLHLVTDKMLVYPISVKDTSAGAWESADTYWGEKSKQFLMWALDKKMTLLEDNGEGGYSVRPSIAVAATTKEIRDVVFGSDLYGKGAVIVQKFSAQHFEWDFKRDVLVIHCNDIIQTEGDVSAAHAVYFQIRNDKGRNPQFLHRGLRTIAAMKNHLQGVKVFEKSTRAQVGI